MPADRISPKVVAPTLTLAVATVFSAIVSGDWSNSETALAVATVVTFAVGWLKRDPVRG